MIYLQPPIEYAKGTVVPVSRSEAEIRRVLARYLKKTDGIAIATKGERVLWQFEVEGVPVRLDFALAPKSDGAFWHNRRSRDTMYEAYRRQCWRVMLLIVKGRLEEMAATGLSAAHAFLPYVALPGGGTVGDLAPDVLGRALERGEMPRLLPEGT